MVVRRALILATIALFPAACGTQSEQKEMPAGDTFIALPHHFEEYTDWNVIALGDTGHDGISGQTDTRVYINREIPATEVSLPVGTIVVKEMDDGGDRLILAMAKRGANYNSSRARGWEYFELFQSDAGLGIVWRGTNSPQEESYRNDRGVEEDCNRCHAGATDRDILKTPGIFANP